VTCRPSKLVIAGEQSVKNKKGKEIRVKKTENTTQLQRRRHTGIWKSHYILLLSECSFKYGCNSIKCNSATDNTGYRQKNGAVSINKKFISHLTRAQRTPSAAATLQVSHALITILQCVQPGSHDTHPHGNQIHPGLGVACPL
jgi:hypothetical protein